jgi:hypothetical protein
MDFEEVEKGIIDREETRSRKAAQKELALWRKNFVRETEIRVLERLLKITNGKGRAGMFMTNLVLNDVSKHPHPLSAFTRDDPDRTGLVHRCLKMVRFDYECLLRRAGEEDNL